MKFCKYEQICRNRWSHRAMAQFQVKSPFQVTLPRFLRAKDSSGQPVGSGSLLGYLFTVVHDVLITTWLVFQCHHGCGLPAAAGSSYLLVQREKQWRGEYCTIVCEYRQVDLKMFAVIVSCLLSFSNRDRQLCFQDLGDLSVVFINELALVLSFLLTITHQ